MLSPWTFVVRFGVRLVISVPFGCKCHDLIMLDQVIIGIELSESMLACVSPGRSLDTLYHIGNLDKFSATKRKADYKILRGKNFRRRCASAARASSVTTPRVFDCSRCETLLDVRLRWDKASSRVVYFMIRLILAYTQQGVSLANGDNGAIVCEQAVMHVVRTCLSQVRTEWLGVRPALK